jgi:Predicted membrane protein
MVEWSELFALRTPPLEILARGTVTYLALFAMLRFLLKRESGTTGVTDLLVIVLIADAAQNAMAGQYTTITDGVLLVAVIIGWSFLLDFVAFYIPAAARIIRPRPLLLVRNGRILHRNMRRELVTEAELRSLLREQGIDNLSRVREARMEPDGQISVISRIGHPTVGSFRKKRRH